MITGIVIENFKGVRDRVEIELRPLTLLFGANSAGKSTIVEALELFEQLLLDRHHRRGKSLTRRLGERIGGVREAVFGQARNAITLGITIKSHESWHDYFESLVIHDSGFSEGDPTWSGCTVPDGSDCSLGGDPAETLSLELTFAESLGISDSALSMYAQITRIVIQVNGRMLARLEKTPTDHGSTRTIAWYVDTEHPVFDDSITRVGIRKFHVDMRDIIPRDNEPPILAGFCDDLDDGPLAVSLNLAVLAVLVEIEEELAKVRRIGPLRQVPPNQYFPKPHPPREEWLSGLAAWDLLGFISDDLLVAINGWLGPENLDCGVQIIRQVLISLEEALSIIELSANEPARIAMSLLHHRSSGIRQVKLRPIGSKYGGAFEADVMLSPSQVGTGVSQIVPIVVACVSRNEGLVGISQPELHLHPRLQVKLADIFIECITEQDSDASANRMIVETHSEHLILRLLRRIRETKKGTAPAGCEIASDDIAVYHVAQEHGQSKICRLEIDENGQFIQPWPDEFFEIDFYERFS